MNILITGCTGFIGRNLLKKLSQEQHRLVCLTRIDSDITKIPTGKNISIRSFDLQDDLYKIFQEEKIEAVIHLASLFLVQHTAVQIPDLISSNILFGTKLLDAAVQAKCKWFLNTGTFWQHFENKSYSPVNLYGATKEAFEKIAQFYIEANQLNFCTLKLNDTYGPGDERRKIMNIWKEIATKGTTLDMGPGMQIMDMVYIDDVVDAYISLVTHLTKTPEAFRAKSFAITSAERVTLKELADIFQKATGHKLSINWGARSYREREVMSPWTKFETVPGWSAKVSLEEGMKKLLSN
jgi:CDP-paratose synthetase